MNRGRRPPLLEGGESGEDEAVERDLVKGLRARDPKAFEHLTRSYGPMVLSAARLITRDESDARDCVQETFLSVFRSIGRFEGRSRLSTWLHRIVTNAALMRLRARRSRPEDAIDPQGPTYDEFSFREGPRRANGLTPEELLARGETRDLVQGAIGSLSQQYRLILVLRDIEGFSTAEVAEMLGDSEGAIKTRLHRARNALKEFLQPLFEEDLS